MKTRDGNFHNNLCQCFQLAFRTKTLQWVCTYMATEEPASSLSFLSTLCLTTAHIKMWAKKLSVGIHICRALSIDDFVLVPVFLILRFWNAFVTFSIHIPALNWSHVEKENDFAFSNENFQNLPPASATLHCCSPFFPNLQNRANENK